MHWLIILSQWICAQLETGKNRQFNPCTSYRKNISDPSPSPIPPSSSNTIFDIAWLLLYSSEYIEDMQDAFDIVPFGLIWPKLINVCFCFPFTRSLYLSLTLNQYLFVVTGEWRSKNSFLLYWYLHLLIRTLSLTITSMHCAGVSLFFLVFFTGKLILVYSST